MMIIIIRNRCNKIENFKKKNVFDSTEMNIHYLNIIKYEDIC